MSDFENNLDQENTLTGSGISYDANKGYVGNDSAKWYVVHTYSGHEVKVKQKLIKLVENRGMQDLIIDVVVPTENVKEVKENGRSIIKERKKFPGYVLVKMIVTNESWYLVRNTQGVTGFVGHGSEPIPLTDEEAYIMEREMGLIRVRFDMEIGDAVNVISGPLKGCTAFIEEINVEKETVKARVSMFGRDTLAELEFGQIDKL